MALENDLSEEDIVDASARLRFRHIVVISRALFCLFFALSAILAISAAALIVFVALGSDSGFATSTVEVSDEILSLTGFALYAIVLFVAGLIFRDISHGESPFRQKQARRIRIIAWLLLSIAIIEALIPIGIIMDNALGGSVLGLVNASSYTPPIRIGSIIVAVVFFFLSSIFDYGIRLQVISNDTV